MRLRIAPSPTGDLHMGSVLTLVANLAAARSAGGDLAVRIDDTDTARSSDAYVDALLEDLRWLGALGPEAVPVFQSARSAAHAAAVESLIDAGAAYRCFCSPARLDALAREQEAAGQPPRYDGACRELDPSDAAARAAAGEEAVIRLRVDTALDVDLEDAVRGTVHFPAGSFADFVILRADGTPVYLLASIVDDMDMEIDLVLRGEDHLSNAPRQLALADALVRSGRRGRVPRFGHLPLLRDAAGHKLSKRSGAGMTVRGIRAAGHEPGPVRAWAMELLGHGPVDPLSLPEGGGWLRLDAIPVAAPRLDLARLAAVGREAMASRPVEELVALVQPELGSVASEDLGALVADLATEAHGVSDLARRVREILQAPSLDAAEFDTEVAQWALDTAAGLLEDPQADAGMVIGALKRAASERGDGVGAAMRPVRCALTGQRRGPRLDAVVAAIGRDEALRRLAAARAVTTQGAG